MIGLSHRTAPLDLRERVAVSGDAMPALLDRVRGEGAGVEAVVLSTCNRTEIYVARPTHEPPDADRLRHLLAAHAGIGPDVIAAATLHREQDRAALHLFRVCGGLDSMVIGEPQILGQVKRAYEAATNHGAVGPALHRLFQDAIRAGKMLRSETGIGEGRVSVGSVAMDFARQVFDRFEDKTVLAVGAGEMVKAALRRFDETPGRLWVVNRSRDRALALADALGVTGPRGGARAWADLDDLLVEADVVLTCTAATEPILTAARMKPIVKRRRRRPLFVLDLALPRDVEASVGALANVYLYNLDDLQSVVAATAAERREEIEACEQRLAEAVGRCMMAVQHRDVGQLVRQLRHRLHDLGELETQRTLRKLASAGNDPAALGRALEEHTQRLINKILHLPLSQINQHDADAPLGFYAAALRRLFDLEETIDAPPEAPPPEVPQPEATQPPGDSHAPPVTHSATTVD